MIGKASSLGPEMSEWFLGAISCGVEGVTKMVIPFHVTSMSILPQ